MKAFLKFAIQIYKFIYCHCTFLYTTIAHLSVCLSETWPGHPSAGASGGISLEIHAMTCNPLAVKVSWLNEPLLVSKGPKEAEFARFALSCCDQFAEMLRSRITIKEVGRNGNIPGLLSAVPVEYCPLGVAGIYQLGRLSNVRFNQDRLMFTRQYLKEILNPVVLVETVVAGN